MDTALITGVSGFVGQHLARSLLEQGWRVVGCDLQPLPGLSRFVRLDVTDPSDLQPVLQEERPAVLFHLAGALKSEQVEQFYRTHVLGTVSLLETVVKSGLRPRVLIASSSAVYGAGTNRKPISERFKPRPVTHYAVSKLAQELAALRYQAAFGIPVLCSRTFNLLGPGLSTQMACSAFARQIALAEKSGAPGAIATGNLDARRDFVDVRDAVRAYRLLAEKARAGQVYNVASGRAVAIRDCLDFLLKQAKVPVDTFVDQRLVQPNDVPLQVGSAERLRLSTGWEAQISLERSLLDMLEDWRNKIRME